MTKPSHSKNRLKKRAASLAEAFARPSFTGLVELIIKVCKSGGVTVDEAVELTAKTAIADLGKEDEAAAWAFAELLKRAVRERMAS
jgi:hypothetical protein